MNKKRCTNYQSISRFGTVKILAVLANAALVTMLTGNRTEAATIYWDGINAASWNLNTNWSTSSGATTPDPVSPPGSGDDAVFNITTVNGNQSLTLGSVAQAAQSLTFNNTGTTTITAGGTNSTLTVGSGGIAVASTAGAVTIGGGTNQNVPIVLAANQTWTVDGSTSLTAQNNYTGNFNLIKAGTGSLTLVGSNASTGTITNNAGTLTISEISASTLTGGGIINNASLVLFHSGAVTASSVTKVISGAGSIEKTGNANSARTQLNGTNTFTGVLTLTSGNLTVTTIGNGGVASNLGAASAAAGNLVFNGTGAAAGGGNLDYRGVTATSDRAFTINAGKTASFTLTSATAGASLTLAGATGAATTGGLYVDAGAGRALILSGANTYTGNTTILTGTLQIGNGGAGSLGSGNYAGNIANTGTLAFNSTVNQTLSGIISGTAGTLTQSGPSTLTLTGANTYTGATNVNVGTLLVNGSLAAGSAVTVASGATLGGNGTINGNTTVNGTLAPGSGPATLTLGGTLSLAAGSTLAFDLGTASDKITFVTLANSLSGSGNSTLSLSLGSGFSYANSYTIFENVTTAGFNLAGITGYDTTNYNAVFAQSGNNYNLTFTSVPEPSTYALVGMGLGALWFLRRKPRKQV